MSNRDICDMFGVKRPPALWLVDMSNSLKKFNLGHFITYETVSAGIEDYKAKKLKPEYKSADEKDHEHGKPYEIVGSNFKKITSEKDVLVKFYAPWCGHCKELAPKWDQLAELMKDEDVVVAKYDATANENEGVKIEGFPTIKFYTSGKEYDYTGKRELKDFVIYLKEHATLKGTYEHDEL